jgi:hypothetical protein
LNPELSTECTQKIICAAFIIAVIINQDNMHGVAMGGTIIAASHNKHLKKDLARNAIISVVSGLRSLVG